MLIEEAFDETMNQEDNKEFPYLDPQKDYNRRCRTQC